MSMLTVLSMIMIGATAHANNIIKKKPEPYSYIVEQPIGDTVAFTVVTGEDALSEDYQIQISRFDVIISRIFVSIALLGALSYLISNLPGYSVPRWFNLVIPCFTYGSAAIFYLFVRKDIE